MKQASSTVKAGLFVSAIYLFLNFGQSAPAQSASLAGGTISFYGEATINAPITSATKFTGIYGMSGASSHPLVNYLPSGCYSSMPVGTPVVFNPFIFGPTTRSARVDFTLWSFSLGPTNYSFEVTSETYLSRSCGLLNIGGTGTAFVDGFAYTNATWQITDITRGCSETFAETSQIIPPVTQPVPEPSAAVLTAGGAFIFSFLRFVQARRNTSLKGSCGKQRFLSRL